MMQMWHDKIENLSWRARFVGVDHLWGRLQRLGEPFKIAQPLLYACTLMNALVVYFFVLFLVSDDKCCCHSSRDMCIRQQHRSEDVQYVVNCSSRCSSALKSTRHDNSAEAI